VLSAAKDLPSPTVLPSFDASRQETPAARPARLYDRALPCLCRANFRCADSDPDARSRSSLAEQPSSRAAEQPSSRAAEQPSSRAQFSLSAAIGVSANTSRPVNKPIATASAIIAPATIVAGANAGIKLNRKMK